MGLVAGQPVDDVGPHFLERAGPTDVGLLVEAGLQLDEHRDLLAVLGGPGERQRDRRGRAHAVERHLDREHPRIDGGLADEAGDRVEGVVRVVGEDVAAPDRAPDVRATVEGGQRAWGQRLILEPRQVDGGVELEEIGERGEAGARVEVVGLKLELVDQHGEEIGREIGVVLQADRVAHAPLSHARLHARQEIHGPLALERDVGIPRDPDGVAGDDLIAAVQGGELEADHVLQEHEGVGLWARAAARSAPRPGPGCGPR